VVKYIKRAKEKGELIAREEVVGRSLERREEEAEEEENNRIKSQSRIFIKKRKRKKMKSAEPDSENRLQTEKAV